MSSRKITPPVPLKVKLKDVEEADAGALNVNSVYPVSEGKRWKKVVPPKMTVKKKIPPWVSAAAKKSIV